MAWLTRDDPRPFSRMPNEPDLDSLTYWVTRLEPLIRSDNQEEIIVVFCNRTGTEGDATYSGTSAVLGIHDGEVKVYGMLGRGEKELLVVDTNSRPYAKMVYRPDPDRDVNGPFERSPTVQFSTDKSNTSDNTGEATSNPAPKEETSSKSSQEKKEKPAANGIHSNENALYESASSKSRERTGGTESLPVKRQGHGTDSLPFAPQNHLKESSRRRQAPTIDLKSCPKLNGQNGAFESSDMDTFDIPTPSAPSPTPMAIRPKLIIPDSPLAKPYQYTMSNPTSAASEMSVQSIRSNESEASTQTVRSNPRPPEDSTPYPHSGMPFTGYPSKSDKRIYGGHVSIRHHGDFTPITPFDDATPQSPRLFWRPPSDMMRSPEIGAIQPSGTFFARKPEPFPWSDINPRLLPLNQPSHGDRKQNDSTSLQHARRKNSASPESSTSSRRARLTNSTKQTSNEGLPPKKRSPSKSRSASSTRSNDVAVPATELNVEMSPELSRRFMHLAHRSDSNARQFEHTSGTPPIPNRPSSPKSRNCSRTRPSDTTESWDQTIHIVASPSLMDSEGGRPSSAVQTVGSQMQQLPSSRFAHHRSKSSTALASDRKGSPFTGSNIKRPGSRATSRGRQPGPKVSPTKADVAVGQPVRAPSVDSVTAAAYYLQFRKPLSQRRDSPGGGGRQESRRQGSRRRSSQSHDMSQFERVEAVICPNCPVHGTRSASADQSNNRIPMGRPAEPLDPLVPQPMDEETVVVAPRPATVPPPNPVQNNTTPNKPQSLEKRQDQANGETSRDSPKIEGMASSDESSLETVSPKKKSPDTPTLLSPFDPATPKAMSFSPDIFGADSFSDKEYSKDEAKISLLTGTASVPGLKVSGVMS